MFNKYGNVANENLRVIVSDFFKDDELTNVKNKLYEVAIKVLDEKDLGRCITLKAGDNKRKLETDDILEIIAKLDKATVKLPTLVAANLSRIPSVIPGMADVATLTATVSIIKEEVEKLRKEMSSWKASNNNTKEIYPELHGEKSRIALPDRKTINSYNSTGAICRQERNAITYADSLKENHEGSWFQARKSEKVVKDDTYKNHKIQ